MIDLHTHTTASDGRCTPAELVARAAAAGVTVMAVTDHDTVSGCDAAAASCAAAGIAFVAGIEITAVRSTSAGRATGDVHMLGYFIDPASSALDAFLVEQRRQRIDRLREVAARLASLGMPLDIEAILQPAIEDPRKSAGRPWIARALVARGYVASSDEAFEHWLVRGRPAFVPRPGASTSEVISRVHDAKGICSLAHPALMGTAGEADWIGDLVSNGLDAIEAYHSEHDSAATARYLAMASTMGVAVSGGSDYHGDPSHGPDHPGAVSLPRADYEELVRRATIRATASGASTSS